MESVMARAVPLFIFAASCGALGVAYIAQYVFGLEPCLLCLYQRLPYVLTGALALGALCLPEYGRAPAMVTGLSAALFLIGAGIAFYHVGVEAHWWDSVVACGGGLAPEMNADDLLATLQKPSPPSCDAPAWKFMGVSMAGYNGGVSLVLAGACLVAARRLRTGWSV